MPDGLHQRTPRVPMPTLPVDERVKGFDEVDLGYTEQQAIEEAKRCLHCSVCSECLQCVTVCKAEAICHEQQDIVEQVDVGAVIVVPGFEEFVAKQKYDFGFSRYPDVVTSVQFERILSASGKSPELPLLSLTQYQILSPFFLGHFSHHFPEFRLETAHIPPAGDMLHPFFPLESKEFFFKVRADPVDVRVAPHRPFLNLQK